ELDGVGCRQVEQPLACPTGAEVAGVEPGRDFLPDLIAPAANARSNTGPDVPAAVLVGHEANGRSGDARLSPAPTRVHHTRDALFRIPQDDRVAVGVGGEQRDATAAGDQRVDVVDRATGLVDP